MFIFTFILFYILLSISIEDYKTMLISENKLLILMISGFTYLTTLGLSNEIVSTSYLVVNSLISMVILFSSMYLLSYTSFKIFKINSLGIGDIKLTSISTIWLGIELSFLSLCISFMLSAVYSLYGKITRRFTPFQQYPFAPFLSIGIFSSWIIDKI